MKLILAMRQRKIDYRREAKRKLILPQGGANEINYPREARPQGRKKYCHGWGAAVRPKEYRRDGAQPQGLRNIAVMGRSPKAEEILP
jgi:hypothetical protein